MSNFSTKPSPPSLFVAQAGPIPHTPATGKVVSFDSDAPTTARDVASGYSLINYDGTFSVVLDRIDLPTSLDFVDDDAYIVTLDGEVWNINNITRPPHHRR